jgi:hypothetical protein
MTMPKINIIMRPSNLFMDYGYRCNIKSVLQKEENVYLLTNLKAQWHLGTSNRSW